MARNARIAEASTHPDDGTDATVMQTRKTIRNRRHKRRDDSQEAHMSTIPAGQLEQKPTTTETTLRQRNNTERFSVQFTIDTHHNL